MNHSWTPFLDGHRCVRPGCGVSKQPTRWCNRRLLVWKKDGRVVDGRGFTKLPCGGSKS